MPFNVNTPSRPAKIAHYLRMIERRTPVWDPVKYAPLVEALEREKIPLPDPDQTECSPGLKEALERINIP